MPQVAASEQGEAQTLIDYRLQPFQQGSCGKSWQIAASHCQEASQQKHLEKCAIAGKSPVCEGEPKAGLTQSTTGPEEPRGKQGGPPPKAKYYPATDSGQVP
jgi:hypothetical protein